MTQLGPADIDLATLSFLVGGAANRWLLAAIRKEGHPHLRNAHGYVFQHLVEGPRTISELKARMGISQQAVSKIVGELLELGYLERQADVTDRRLTRVGLSLEGQGAVEESRRQRAAVESRLKRTVGERGLADAKAALWALMQMVGDTDELAERRALPPEDSD